VCVCVCAREIQLLAAVVFVVALCRKPEEKGEGGLVKKNDRITPSGEKEREERKIKIKCERERARVCV